MAASSDFKRLSAVPLALALLVGLWGRADGADLRVRIGARGAVTVTGDVKSLKELKERNVVIQRYDYSCGSAALATILNYQFGDVVGEQEIVVEMLKRGDLKKIIERKGFSLLDMKRYAERRGYRVAGYRMDFEDLVNFQTPVIVPIVINEYRHFVIFKGARSERVFLADPAFGNRTMPAYQFVKAWHDFENVGLVIRPESNGKAPPGGKLLDVSEADAIYIGSASFQPALRAMPSLFTRDPMSW